MPEPKTRTLADGTVRWFVRLRHAGKQTSVTFATEPEAEQFCLDIEQRGADWAMDNYLDSQSPEQNEMTLSEWAVRYFASLTDVGPAALAGYKSDWTRRWEPHLGHMRLSRITREHVAAALNAQTGADKTVKNAWGVLASIFKLAVIDGHIAKSPTAGVRRRRRTSHERVEHRYLSPAEIYQLVEDTTPHYRPLIWMLAGTGMRWGEATALTIADLDLENSTVRVNKAWKRDPIKGVFYVGPTKTPKSRRTITLPREVVEPVAPLVVGRARGDLLFVNKVGDYVHHQTFYADQWKRATRNLAEPRPRVHDLRHSHVAILLSQGVSLPVIQARLGHEKITTTIDTYGHLMPDLHIGAASAVSHAFQSARQPAALEPPAPPRLD